MTLGINFEWNCENKSPTNIFPYSDVIIFYTLNYLWIKHSYTFKAYTAYIIKNPFQLNGELNEEENPFVCASSAALEINLNKNTLACKYSRRKGAKWKALEQRVLQHSRAHTHTPNKNIWINSHIIKYVFLLRDARGSTHTWKNTNIYKQQFLAVLRETKPLSHHTHTQHTIANNKIKPS